MMVSDFAAHDASNVNVNAMITIRVGNTLKNIVFKFVGNG